MLNVAGALPAGPDERDGDVFPLRERLRLRDDFGLALLELRARDVEFQRLRKGPWALFIGIAVHWQGNAEAWPSQETLARFSGWSTRAVRDQADSLERGGFVRVRRERRADGSERIFYAPGLVTLAALADFVERFPRERAKPLRIQAPPPADPTPTHPPATAADAPPEGASMEPRDQDQIEPSSCQATPSSSPSAPVVAEEQQVEVTREDQEIARKALAERMKRKHPTRRAARWFDAGELAMVAACSAALEGDAAEKLVAHRDAIAGAFITSKDGAPTVRFIWEKLDHFFDHVDRGRRRRLADERAVRKREESAAAAKPPPRATQAFAAIPRDQMDADLERIFGPGSMFRDDGQLARACHALLAMVGLGRLWTANGPTAEASELLEANGGPLSSGERVMLLAAWAFWNGSGGLALAEILQRLDSEPTEALCFLVMSSKYGADAVDDWLAENARLEVAS